MFSVWLLYAAPAYADVAPPPPTLEFTLEYAIAPPAIVTAQLIPCEDISCSKTRHPRYVQCGVHSCTADVWSTWEAKAFQLVINFADKTRTSHTFLNIGYHARYVVTVRDNDLLVSALPYASLEDFLHPYQITFFQIALVWTLIIELGVAKILTFFKISVQLRWVLLANLLSLPFVWFVFPLIPIRNPFVGTGLSEVFAVVCEAAIFYAAHRARQWSFGRAAGVSLLLNLVSFGLPFLVLLYVSRPY